LPESVYFYTFHKCASTLFSSYILKNIEGLQHIDYEDLIYSGKIAAGKKLAFKDRGYVYGPIRLSITPTNPLHPIYDMLTKRVIEHDFIRDKITIFFVRDPRDILVSSYYSFGHTHGFSKVKEIRDQEEATRSSIQAKSLDEYVLASAKVQAKNFKTLNELASACERSIILKYENMINNFDYFISKLSNHIHIEENVAREIYLRSRPKQQEDITSHRRSGQVGGFRCKLNEKTIDALNRSLEETLTIFGYDA
jgi:hypothetical protein